MTPNEIVDKVIWSLDNEPERWLSDRYEYVRDDGLRIWIANKISALSVTASNGAIIGGMSDMTILFGWLIPWRRKLWRRCKPIPPLPPRRLEFEI